MTLNELIKEAQAIANRFSTGDVPLDKEVHLEIADMNFGGYPIKVKIKNEE